tara:strand:- start:241 stop:1188 length:948 start_codon:yes stop_codon:yes gene_type:complete
LILNNTIEILRAGIYSSIQDLRRVGFKKYGIPKSGPMDEYSHILTNWLLNKDIYSETIEITHYGPKIRINFKGNIAIFGSNCDAQLNNKKIEIGVSIKVKNGDILDIKKCIDGNRAYLGFSGEMKLKKVFKSLSTYEKIGIGGISGTKLNKNDTIYFKNIKNPKIKNIPSSFIKRYDQNNIIRIIKGMHFNKVDNEKKLLNNDFNISPNSDRMGLRLINNSIKLNFNDEIESTVVTKGTIQIPRDGNPIILMSDSQSTGGYPIIGNICKADISKISQIKPNKSVRFKMVSLTESNRILQYERKKFKSKLGIDLSA